LSDVGQTEPGDDVGDLKGSNVNHNNLANSEPGAGAGDAAPVSLISLVAMVTLINVACII